MRLPTSACTEHPLISSQMTFEIAFESFRYRLCEDLSKMLRSQPNDGAVAVSRTLI